MSDTPSLMTLRWCRYEDKYFVLAEDVCEWLRNNGLAEAADAFEVASMETQFSVWTSKPMWR